MTTTEVKQNIPKGWRKASLESLATKLKTGGTPTSTNKNFYGGNIPFVKIDDMTTSGKYLSSTISSLSNEGLENSSAWIVPKGSILYSIYATVGEVSINSIDAATNQAIMGIIVDEKEADRDYLYQYLLSIKPSLRKHFKETTQKNLTSQIVKGLEILVPESKKEQKKIAEILGAVDGEIQKTDEIIAATEKLKRGLMQQLFARGIGHAKFKKTKIGNMPAEWELVRLRDVVKFTNGKAHEKDIDESGKYIVVNSKFISTNGRVFKRTDKPLSPLSIGDITMVMSDIPKGKALAKCFFVEENEKYTLNQRVCSLKSTRINNRFLFYTLNRNKYFLDFDNGVGQTNFRKDEVLNCPIQLPPEREQQKIVEMLSAVDGKVSVNKKLKEKLTLLKKGLMQDLLSGRVRVMI
ncbi:MAG: hypothetical protein A3G61_02950 [Candidatus Taylorbacteria bacterium RIFCSPLOWO2_12_FULL_49_67]|nr:MAG: hypothetical protein A3G61_02950 [Candidatus Taylorbacteria bacterium RIFCSPLOWO2_12_FULL_49_67]